MLASVSIWIGTHKAAGMAAVAGYVNAVAFLGLHTFVAPMTGTVVQAGFELSAMHWPEVGKTLLVVVAFACGVAFARLSRRDGRGPGLAWLVVALVLGVSAVRPLDGLLSLVPIAAALGCLNGSETRFGPVVMNTTFLTGNLERLGEAIGDRAMPHRLAQLACIAAIIIPYLAGATAGAVATQHLAMPLLVPAGLLLLAGVAGLVRSRSAVRSSSRQQSST